MKGEDLNCRKFAPTRPEGAEAPSPGQSPWVNQQSTLRPVRAKALKISFHSTFYTPNVYNSNTQSIRKKQKETEKKPLAAINLRKLMQN